MDSKYILAVGYFICISIDTTISSLSKVALHEEQVQLSYATESGEDDRQGSLGDHDQPRRT